MLVSSNVEIDRIVIQVINIPKEAQTLGEIYLSILLASVWLKITSFRTAIEMKALYWPLYRIEYNLFRCCLDEENKRYFKTIS